MELKAEASESLVKKLEIVEFELMDQNQDPGKER